MSDFILMMQLGEQHRQMMDVQLSSRRDNAILSQQNGAAVANYNNLLRDYRALERYAKQRIFELERQLADTDLARQRAEAEAAYERTNGKMLVELAKMGIEPFAG
jgi:hypothetical protein